MYGEGDCIKCCGCIEIGCIEGCGYVERGLYRGCGCIEWLYVGCGRQRLFLFIFIFYSGCLCTERGCL